MRIIFVRHGEPDYANDCLTPNGEIQAKDTAIRLKDEDIRAVYSSPMGRARITASYTAKEHGLDVQVLDFMHELDWGDKEGVTEPVKYEGHPWTLAYELLADDPEAAWNNSWKEHPFFRDNICMEYYEQISEGFDKFLEGYGIARKNGAYVEETKFDGSIAIFAHGGSGAVVLSHLLNIPFPTILTVMPYGVCSVTIVDLEAQTGNKVVPRLELFNDMGHIDVLKAEGLRFEK